MRVKVTELGPIVAWVLGLCVGMIVAGRFVEAAGPGAWWLRLITLLVTKAAFEWPFSLSLKIYFSAWS